MKPFIPSLLLAIAWGACSTPEMPVVEEVQDVSEILSLTTDQMQAAQVLTGSMSLQSFGDEVQATGMLQVPPADRAAVSPSVGGTVHRIHVTAGQTVRSGDALVTLQHPDYIALQQHFLEAQSETVSRSKEYERLEALATDKIAAEQALEKARSEYEQAEARQNSLAAQLRLLGLNPEQISASNLGATVVLRAPFSGRIARLELSQGSFLAPGTEAIIVINPERMRAELQLLESDLKGLKKGQKVYLHYPGGVPFEATLAEAGVEVDPASRTVTALANLQLDSLTEDLIPGRFVEAILPVNAHPSWSLPEEAIVNLDGKAVVLLQSSTSSELHSFTPMPVLTGRTQHGRTEVLNAASLPTDGVYVVKGAFGLLGAG